MQSVVINRFSIDSCMCPVKQQKVTQLLELINVNRLLNSNIFNWQLNLIIGLHRSVGCKILKFKQIQCNIIAIKATQTAYLARIDKNLSQTQAGTENGQQKIEKSFPYSLFPVPFCNQLKSKNLPEKNCFRGGEIITQPPKIMGLPKELGYARLCQHQQINRKLLPEVKEGLESTKIVKSTKAIVDEINTQAGDRWFLEPHLIYCGDTSGNVFINSLPSNTALAIATPSSIWNHDYLIDVARVVAVLRSEGYVHELCRRHQMTFKFELLIGNIYVGIFSRQSIPKPQRPIEIEGLEGIVSYLIDLYTERDNSVILPFLGAGEVLVACERMGRICFAGDENPSLVNRAIARWQNLTGKQPYKLFYRS